DELHVVFAFLAEEFEQLVEKKLRRDDCRAHVPGETVAFRHGRPAAQLIELLDQRYPIPAFAQAQRCGDPAKTGPDHHGVLSHSAGVYGGRFSMANLPRIGQTIAHSHKSEGRIFPVEDVYRSARIAHAAYDPAGRISADADHPRL